MPETLENAPRRSIRTVSGLYVNPFDPDPNTIIIEDIAHALSNIPRWGGHLKKNYSVARHSLHCSRIATTDYKLTALLHDASEAYLLDMPSPIKNELTEYKPIESKLMQVIARKFGIMFPFPKEVKMIDQEVLQMEWDCLMLGNFEYNERNPLVYTPSKKKKVREEFLSTFKKLSL